MDLLSRKRLRDKKREEEIIKQLAVDELFKKPEKAYVPTSKKLTIIFFVLFVIAVPYMYLKTEVVIHNECGLMPGIECGNINIEKGSVSFDVSNFLKEQFNITLQMQGCNETISQAIKPNNMATYNFSCRAMEARVSKDIFMTYVGFSGLPHTKTGHLTARIG